MAFQPKAACNSDPMNWPIPSAITNVIPSHDNPLAKSAPLKLSRTNTLAMTATPPAPKP